MMLSAILCCQVFGGALGFDHVVIDEEALLVAIDGELKSEGRAQIRSLGGYSPAAFPVYLKYLDQEPEVQHWGLLSRIMLMVREAEGDKSAFRIHAVKLLSHEHLAVSSAAVALLREIGTADDAAAVAALLKRETRDVSYYHSVVETLAVIGTEKEVEALEAARKAGLKHDYPRFWARVDECEKAIRERAAKKKDKDLKATPPEKK